MQIVRNAESFHLSHICMKKQKIASFKLHHDNTINLDYFVSSTNSIQLDCTKGKSSYNSICVLFDFSSMSHPSSFDVGNSFQHINLHSTAYLPLSHKLFLDTMQSVMSRIHKIILFCQIHKQKLLYLQLTYFMNVFCKYFHNDAFGSLFCVPLKENESLQSYYFFANS